MSTKGRIGRRKFLGMGAAAAGLGLWADLEEPDPQAVRSARATLPGGASATRFLGRGNLACGSIRNWAGFRPKCGRS